MKLAKRVEQFPMQDEHEKRKNGVGVARLSASANVECREPEPGTDSGVFKVKLTHRVCGNWSVREVRVGGAGAGSGGLGRAGHRSGAAVGTA